MFYNEWIRSDEGLTTGYPNTKSEVTLNVVLFTYVPVSFGQKIISNQTKSVFILTLVKSFSRQCFRQNFFLSDFEWVPQVAKLFRFPVG